ncbi:2Fe-2S iron-sulfur cluster-binding protein [Croceicoccus sp. Ery5]|uniref:2Fe-2S iron-sulfur cluster-binding protein n=1 Tax=Croceicoccus sp. Ery5 TaxID=1703340 RepID=UPI001E54E0EE|nr:2Fe-2S iron-sulfur cluster-binding protein [Croceicoccus sp. Ery5]
MGAITVRLTDVDGKEVTIDDCEAGETLMEAARRKGVAGIIAECGGACSCATCHVYVDEEWIDMVGEPDDVEEDMLDMVDDIRRPNSRLSCQVKLTARLDGLTAEVAPEL